MSQVKRKRKPRKAFVQIISLVVICISAYLIYGVVKEVITTIDLKKQLEFVEGELAKVQEENASLTSQKEKLEDPGYVESYARGNYMLSKDGEQIFYLPDETK